MYIRDRIFFVEVFKMSIRSTLAVLFISVFCASVSAAADQDRVENLKLVVGTTFEELFTKQVSKKLSDSGIAKTDSDRIVRNLVATSASCVVDALVQQAEEQSIDADELLDAAEAALSDKKSNEDFLDVLDEDELELKMESCILIAFENAGLQFRM